MSDLREALSAAYDKADTTPSPEVAENPVQVDQGEGLVTEPEQGEEKAAEGRSRDEKGRFAAKQETEQPQPEVKATEVKEQVQPEVQAVERKAPTTWRKEAAAQWASIPDSLKDEILKRENDARLGIQNYKSAADIGRQYEEASKPFSQTFQQLGVTPVQAFQYLLNADAKLRYSNPQEKARYFSELARNYGIDLSQVVQLPPVPPEYQQMQQELNKLRQQQTRWEEQQNASLNSEIERFAETHEHLEAVRPAMAVLLEKGLAKDLQDAYEKAIWADPEIRSLLISKQTSNVQVKAEKAALVDRQRKAAVSVKGSTPASGSSGGNATSVRSAIESAWEEHS